MINHCKEEKKKLSQILLESNSIGSEASKYADLPTISLKDFHISESQQKPISQSYAFKNRILVTDNTKEGIKIAIAKLDNVLMEELKKVFPKKIEFYLAEPQEIESHLERIYGMEYDGKLNKIIDYSLSEVSTSPYIQNRQTSKAIQIVDYILKTAIERGASDIHIEAKKTTGKVKIRIDGVLKQLLMPKEFKKEYFTVVSRIKILTNSMKLDEKVIPQDGSFSLEYQTKKHAKQINFRVSTVNSSYGESIMLRVLDQDKAKVSLADVGFSDEVYNQFLNLIQKPEGMILITGPTGSGKTTTLYAALNELVDPNKKILTAEDPIEYTNKEIVQTELNRARGVNFYTLLKAFLRQDPDIIMVGEVRDEETANTAIRAVQTGHLLLSTLHTTDTTKSIGRIRELKVDPATFLAQTSGIIGQRLVRKVCPHCKEEYIPSKEEIEKYFGKAPVNDITFVKGKGCDSCDFEGYKGRTALTEIWAPGNKELSKVEDIHDAREIRLNAINHGLKTFYEDGIRKLQEKTTTLDELIKTVPNIEEERELYNMQK